MEPTFDALEKLGWRVMRLQDGHQLQACVSTIEEALAQVRLDPTVPIADSRARRSKAKAIKKPSNRARCAHWLFR